MDFRNAYPSLPLDRLSVVLTFIIHFREFGFTEATAKAIRFAELRILESEEYRQLHSFVMHAFSGFTGRGLAVGGNLSPYLLNLFCEVYVDEPLREYLSPRRIMYTRYVDDLYFTSATIISSETREGIRAILKEAGFNLNDLKAQILQVSMGTVFINNWGVRHEQGANVLVFPQATRRKLHGIIKSYLEGPHIFDHPEVVSGYVAGFIAYWKAVKVKTKTDQKTMTLCKLFEVEWAKHRQGEPRRRRPKAILI